jgi:hypothetical protein
LHAAFLAGTPLVLAALDEVASPNLMLDQLSANSTQARAEAAEALLRALFALVSHCERPARIALAQSALQPLVALIEAFSHQDGHEAAHAAGEAAKTLVSFLVEERGSGPGAAPQVVAAAAAEVVAAEVEAAAAAAPQSTWAELHARHLPALRASLRAAAALQRDTRPLRRLLALLGADA